MNGKHTVEGISIAEAVEAGILTVGGTIELCLNPREITLQTLATGDYKGQTIRSEKLEWQYVKSMDAQFSMFVSKEPMRAEITLGGFDGYTKGTDTAHEVCGELFGEADNIFAESINRESLDQLPMHMRSCKRNYLLATQHQYSLGFGRERRDYYKMLVMYNGIPNPIPILLYNSDGKNNTIRFPLRPVIYITKDYKVTVNN